jgi:tocopherol O-methyltransferase
MIAVEGVKKTTIRQHYQLGTAFYWLLWGPHIHHGLWTGEESCGQAQCQLTDTLADLAEIQPGDEIVDIGCGMGGSAIRLARLRRCTVTGVTISPVQRSWAALTARVKRQRQQTRFIAADAEHIKFQPASFDVVWSIECTEHLFDKAAFFRHAAGWLRPGGRLAISVWFEGEDSSRPGHRQQVEEVCRRFVCPSLATQNDYANWITDAGLRVRRRIDWTDRAAKTWEICKRRVARTGVRHIARLLDKDQVDFLDGFDTLLSAYRTGAMQYGAIIAEKPIE